MYKLYIFVVLVIVMTTSILTTQPLYAVSQNLVISQVQTNSLDGGSALEELVEIYNNSDVDVNITDWCVKYGSAGSTTPSKTLVCFKHTQPVTGNYVFLPARSYIVLVSNTFKDKYPDFGYDFTFPGGMVDDERWLSINNSSNNIVDTVQWGNFASETADELSTAETKTAALPAESQLLQRKTLTDGDLQDTDNNFGDFESASARLLYNHGPIYEIEDLCLNIDGIQMTVPDGYIADSARSCSLPLLDVCTNLDNIQLIVPSGYMLDGDGYCQRDVCLNIDGLQLILPDGMELDANGDCVVHDTCANLPGIQSDIPDGFKRSGDNDCVLGLLPLQITELLPNAIGSDVGNEFIEIYNPNDSDVSLLYYFLYIGSDYVHFYSFPTGSHISPGQYLAFSNNEIKFTLVNTTGSVWLRSLDNSVIVDTPIYENPGDGMAWALIDDVWQFTNQPTPNAANLPSLIKTVAVVNTQTNNESDSKPCAVNQYRSPETNRCRLIPTTDSILAPCKDGQYRSEETNRCRSIVSDVSELTQCAEGQERNPETNRCRAVAVLGTSELAPCKEGQERNPETNRCRNIVSDMPQADFAPKQISQADNNYVLWWSIAGVGSVAVIYGVWEWRQEIGKLVYKINGIFGRHK